jgi:hypothetical protein
MIQPVSYICATAIAVTKPLLVLLVLLHPGLYLIYLHFTVQTLFSKGGIIYANGKYMLFNYIFHATGYAITILFKFVHQQKMCSKMGE